MTEHFKRSLKALTVLAALLVGDYLWFRHSIHDIIVPPQITLPRNDKELISYNENRHIITVTTTKGITRQYSRDPSVEVRSDGTIKVNDHAWGTEFRPFLGVGYSDTGRAYIGTNLLYFRQFDFGASFGWTADNRHSAFQPMLSLGWNFWSNTSLDVGVNPAAFVLSHKTEIAVFLSIKI